MGKDKFVLKTIDGKILATEQEHKKILSYDRSASIYDGLGKTSGVIAEDYWGDFWDWNHIFHIYNANQVEVGKTEKNSTPMGAASPSDIRRDTAVRA